MEAGGGGLSGRREEVGGNSHAPVTYCFGLDVAQEFVAKEFPALLGPKNEFIRHGDLPREVAAGRSTRGVGKESAERSGSLTDALYTAASTWPQAAQTTLSSLVFDPIDGLMDIELGNGRGGLAQPDADYRWALWQLASIWCVGGG